MNIIIPEKASEGGVSLLVQCRDRLREVKGLSKVTQYKAVT